MPKKEEAPAQEFVASACTDVGTSAPYFPAEMMWLRFGGQAGAGTPPGDAPAAARGSLQVSTRVPFCIAMYPPEQTQIP